MQIFYGVESLHFFEKPVITIGTFDGVHIGHKTILQQVICKAKAIRGTSILITFDPHPRKVLFPQEHIQLLSTLEERLQAVAVLGVDITVVVPFTKSFSEQSAQAYIEHFLVGFFRPTLLVIGYDHHFGNDRKGNISLLQTMGGQYGFEVEEISAKLISDAAISSTQVRKAIVGGNVAFAHKMLGVPFQIKGKVVLGAQLGRTIGFPTANIVITDTDKIIPKIGVYAVQVLVGNIQFKGMLNIGNNPTVTSSDTIKIEVHIFDFDSNIYGQEITVLFVAQIRSEIHFPNIESLTRQLKNDKETALSILSL